MQNNPFIAWLVENWKRLTEKSPKFFKVWKIIMGIPALLVALPELIEKLISPFTIIHLPQIFTDNVQTVVAWASAVGFWMALLPVKDAEAPVVKEKLPFTKAVGMIAILIALSIGLSAQGFFGSIPKPKSLANFNNARPMTAVQLAESVKNEFRPVTNLASYIIGNNVKESSIITGAGVGYERLQYNTETEKWRIVWSINALAYGRIALGNNSNGKKLMYGFSIGAFDNLLMVGGATDGVNGYGTLGVGIPLNNL